MGYMGTICGPVHILGLAMHGVVQGILSVMCEVCVCVHAHVSVCEPMYAFLCSCVCLHKFVHVGVCTFMDNVVLVCELSVVALAY